MRSHRKVRRLAAALSLACLALVAAEAFAKGGDFKTYQFRRPDGVLGADGEAASALGPGPATKIRVVISQIASEPGMARAPLVGNVTAVVKVNAASCAPTMPTVTTNIDTMIGDWGSPCVLPGNRVVIYFSTPDGPLTLRRSFFTNSAGDSIAPAVPTQVVPAWSTPVAVVLSALLALAGVLAVTRRREELA